VLRKRLIAFLAINEGVLFRTKLFRPDYRYTSNFVDLWSIDELIVVDVSRDRSNQEGLFFPALERFASQCFVPITSGGGIRVVEDVEKFLCAGADKVILNSGAVSRPELISEVSSRYGSQCVVLSVDVRKSPSGLYEVFIQNGAQGTGLDAVTWAQKAEGLGVGEILLTPIERDGSLQGYDLELSKVISEVVEIPVLISGGAGNWQHMVDGINVGCADGVCTQNIYHFTEQSIASAKRALGRAGLPVREAS